MAERSRTGELYLNLRSGHLWRVVCPLHLRHWRLELLLTGGARKRIVRSNAELDDRGKWSPPNPAPPGPPKSSPPASLHAVR